MYKLPRKYKYPLMISMVLPSMLLGMPAILAYKTKQPESSLLETWLSLIGQVIPSALLLLVIVAPLARLIVEKVLLEKA